MTSNVNAANKLMLFGDTNNSEYLGCLSCSEISPDSIHNTIGKYGSEISPLSIHNTIGKYGSSISKYSPCNTIANSPPVIVDEDGGFYGYLTLNSILPKATNDQETLAWLKYKVCSN
ncbi:hypothetical protein AK824_08575 [Psychrobacter sp. P11G3]|nr:hypothetical protein AK824_08575 [Psychrobacter sp. P11G3]